MSEGDILWDIVRDVKSPVDDQNTGSMNQSESQRYSVKVKSADESTKSCEKDEVDGSVNSAVTEEVVKNGELPTSQVTATNIESGVLPSRDGDVSRECETATRDPDVTPDVSSVTPDVSSVTPVVSSVTPDVSSVTPDFSSVAVEAEKSEIVDEVAESINDLVKRVCEAVDTGDDSSLDSKNRDIGMDSNEKMENAKDGETEDMDVEVESIVRPPLSDIIQHHFHEMRMNACSPVSYCSDYEFTETMKVDFVGDVESPVRPDSPYSDCSDCEFTLMRYAMHADRELKNTERPHRSFIRRSAILQQRRSLSPASYYSDDDITRDSFRSPSPQGQGQGGKFLVVSLKNITPASNLKFRGKYECTNCSRCFLSEKLLDRHLKFHMVGVLKPCPLCQQAFESRFLRPHLVKSHGVEDSMMDHDGLKVNVKVVKIESDGEDYAEPIPADRDQDHDQKSPPQRDCRSRSSDKIPDESEDGESTTKMESSTHECPLCGLPFKNLKLHMIKIHWKKDKEKCKDSPKVSKSMNEDHPKISRSDSPYENLGHQCPVCHKFFARLKTHFIQAHRDLDFNDKEIWSKHKERARKDSSSSEESIKAKKIKKSTPTSRSRKSSSSSEDSQSTIEDISPKSNERKRKNSSRSVDSKSGAERTLSVKITKMKDPSRSVNSTPVGMNVEQEPRNRKDRKNPRKSKQHSDSSSSEDSESSVEKMALKPKSKIRKVSSSSDRSSKPRRNSSAHCESDDEMKTSKSKTKSSNKTAKRKRKVQSSDSDDDNDDDKASDHELLVESNQDKVAEKQCPICKSYFLQLTSHFVRSHPGKNPDDYVAGSETLEEKTASAVGTKSKNHVEVERPKKVENSDVSKDSDLKECPRCKGRYKNLDMHMKLLHKDVILPKPGGSDSGKVTPVSSTRGDSRGRSPVVSRDGRGRNPVVNSDSRGRSPAVSSDSRGRSPVVSSKRKRSHSGSSVEAAKPEKKKRFVGPKSALQRRRREQKPSESKKTKSDSDSESEMEVKDSGSKARNLRQTKNTRPIQLDSESETEKMSKEKPEPRGKGRPSRAGRPKTTMEELPDLSDSDSEQIMRTTIKDKADAQVITVSTKPKKPCRICKSLFTNLPVHFGKSHPGEPVYLSKDNETSDRDTAKKNGSRVERNREDKVLSESSGEEEEVISDDDDEDRDEVFPCSTCPMKFADESSLRLHKEAHTDRRTCPICRKAFPNLFNHLHNKCGKTRMKVIPADVSKQGRSKQSAGKKVEEDSDGGRKYECGVCFRNFSDIEKLKLHRKNCSRDDLSPRKKPRSVSESSDAVDKLSSSSENSDDSDDGSELSEAKPKKRGPKKSQDFICKVPDCYREFDTAALLKNHLQTHTGERPFECNKCGKGFKASRYLKKHLLEVHAWMKQ